jgi:ureidoacrylate peracid hydrolase
MNPKTTALVLIEYQNDFTSEGGTLHAAVKPVMDSANMLVNTIELVQAARPLGVTVAWVPISFSLDYHELAAQPYGILKGVVDSQSFRKGTWGAEIVDALKPEPEDIVIEGKSGLCGFLTNCCVESTMRTGYEKGYGVVTLTDCTATVSQEEQDFAVAKNFPMFSRPMDHKAFLAELTG